MEGMLKVYLEEGRGLKEVDFLGKSDPYAVISCNQQEQKSSTLEGSGGDPKWNQSFFFIVKDEVPQVVTIKIFDEDLRTADDAMGTASIPVEQVFEEGEVAVKEYEVLNPSGNPQGVLKVGLKFIPKEEEHVEEHHSPPRPTHGHSNQINHNGYGDCHGNGGGLYGTNSSGGWK